MALAKKSPEFIELVRKRNASTSVGASTARNMGTGTVKAARVFLRNLDLLRFVTESEVAFLRSLDLSTVECSRELPCKSWGAARKFLNIFLRDAMYNRFLCDHFGLAIIEDFLEVPLDKSVALGLHGEPGGESLPAWRTVVGLTPADSATYQAFARRIALEKGFARVHLDLCYYRRDAHEDNSLL